MGRTKMRKAQLCVKRTLDIVLSLCGLLILSPLFAIAAIFIKLDSPGPVFFLQERLGKNGRPFRIIKFRTMVENAEKLGEGLRVSTPGDPRITRAGRILRQTSLDELPQLINVLKGDMSLVGPRPPATYHPYKGYAAYPEWAKKRFEMRPGITGLAQVVARNSVSWDERIRLDVDYVEGFSLWKDVKILLDTVRIVVLRESIYP
jgi:lipopolysaccharide/colanic/teichoic acid biosynthesis glycosyltransferase